MIDRILKDKHIEWLLKAKHWEIFLLIVGIPLIGRIILRESINQPLDQSVGNQFDSMIFPMGMFSILLILGMIFLYSWFWAVSIGLQRKIPNTIKMKVGTFKILSFILIIYLIIYRLSMIFLALLFTQENSANSTGTIPFFLIILPLHLAAFFCFFYCIYFVAKTYKTVELQRTARFSEFISEFILIWLSPIGIWVLQPKINEMAKDNYPDQITKSSYV